MTANLLAELLVPAATDMAAVNTIIEQRLHSTVPTIDQLSGYIIHSGGKRLRPVMAVLAARACGYAGEQHCLLAAIVEFIHTATLLHDDVVDESDLRRGRATANSRFGNGLSVLVGDFLYSRSFQMMVDLGSKDVMDVLATATNQISEGEVLQYLNRRNINATPEQCLAIARSKTATLFEAAARCGALLAGQGVAVQDALGDYGLHFGLAYQLVDDSVQLVATEWKHQLFGSGEPTTNSIDEPGRYEWSSSNPKIAAGQNWNDENLLICPRIGSTTAWMRHGVVSACRRSPADARWAHLALRDRPARATCRAARQRRSTAAHRAPSPRHR